MHNGVASKYSPRGNRKATTMMERLKALEDAKKIIDGAMLAAVTCNPAAWKFLFHVDRYLNVQLDNVFGDFITDDGEAA